MESNICAELRVAPNSFSLREIKLALDMYPDKEKQSRSCGNAGDGNQRRNQGEESWMDDTVVTVQIELKQEETPDVHVNFVVTLKKENPEIYFDKPSLHLLSNQNKKGRKPS